MVESFFYLVFVFIDEGEGRVVDCFFGVQCMVYCFDQCCFVCVDFFGESLDGLFRSCCFQQFFGNFFNFF